MKATALVVAVGLMLTGCSMAFTRNQAQPQAASFEHDAGQCWRTTQWQYGPLIIFPVMTIYNETAGRRAFIDCLEDRGYVAVDPKTPGAHRATSWSGSATMYTGPVPLEQAVRDAVRHELGR